MKKLRRPLRAELARPIAAGLMVTGVIGIGTSLWGAWGWEAACAWWGASLLTAGLSEVL